MTRAMPEWLERLGRPGVLGLGLLLFGLSFYFSSIVPAGAALANLKQEAAQLQARLPGARGVDAVPPGPAAVHETPVEISALPELLKHLNALAGQRGVTMDRASYAVTERDGQRRMEITLPLKAGYPSLRGYLRDVLMRQGAPSLDELTLKRQQSTDLLVEANVRLSYLMRPAP
jgi:hypothetical protein